jgi:CBS domain containing-hemolysin-like protein
MSWETAGALLLKILAVMVLVFLNGFFVAAEFALVKIRETQLDTLIVKGQRLAKVARRLVGNLDACLSACQLGITVASLGLGWVGEPVFSALLEPIWPLLNLDSDRYLHLRETVAVIVGFSMITFLHITVGELAPKSLAIRKPLPISLLVAQPMEWFYKVSYPFIWLLNNASLWMLHRFGLPPASEHELAHSEEELRLLLSASAKQSGATPLGRDIVLNALDLNNRFVREVMEPRREITAFDTEQSIEDCLAIALRTRYSRFPLCDQGDLDRTIGVVHIKDLFAMRLKVRLAAELASVARPMIYVPETARLVRLLQLFLQRKLHFAIVVDEYGGTVGIVTLEDILEELVGQIQDEFDEEHPLIVKRGKDAWDIDGVLPLHELSELVGEEVTEEDVSTTSGLVMRRLGGFPKRGDVLPVGDFELRIEATDHLRVTRLTLTRRATESASE